MEMWQWIALFSAVSLNTLVNFLRLYLEEKERRSWDISSAKEARKNWKA